MKVSTLALLAVPATAFSQIFSPLSNLLSLTPQQDDISLIVTDDNSLPLKVTSADKFKLKRSGVNFIDITDHETWFWSQKDTPSKVPVYNYPTNVTSSEFVTDLIEEINKDNLRFNLAQFSSFFSRYYKSENGLKSATWLFHKLTSIIEEAKQSNPDLQVSISQFQHKWQQFSIIVSVKGQETPDDIVVVGCHQDSTNLLFPTLLKAPGADDDGSGVTTNLEALRILLSSSQFQPSNTMEFHFYSAEEGGLLGSMDIFRAYNEEGKKVVAMLQQDMTGYIQKTLDNAVEEHVGVITDFVSPQLTQFVKLIIDSYLAIPYHETECGYACSDHSSALKNGYPSSFIIESEFKYTNPYIHSTGDTLDRLDFDHIREFVKLVLGYVGELKDHKFKVLGYNEVS
ncbi:hypothetical protein WICPIJ_006449 [Wickerhamomyces pijperi]|uniref:Peptide hydrolase n=1 Tax=Wickerhamomyces pijperi TaxID=599730 RepID=A0A9P8Q4E0_WICPI|nr:hypothetical protein WICPIJ_006449 [Wickerhamomyces pijperi]